MSDFNKKIESLGLSSRMIYDAVDNLNRKLDKKAVRDDEKSSKLRAEIAASKMSIQFHGKQIEQIGSKIDQLITTSLRHQNSTQNLVVRVDGIEKRQDETDKNATKISDSLEEVKIKTSGFSLKNLQTWAKIIPYIILSIASIWAYFEAGK